MKNSSKFLNTLSIIASLLFAIPAIATLLNDPLASILILAGAFVMSPLIKQLRFISTNKVTQRLIRVVGGYGLVIVGTILNPDIIEKTNETSHNETSLNETSEQVTQRKNNSPQEDWTMLTDKTQEKSNDCSSFVSNIKAETKFALKLKEEVDFIYNSSSNQRSFEIGIAKCNRQIKDWAKKINQLENSGCCPKLERQFRGLSSCIGSYGQKHAFINSNRDKEYIEWLNDEIERYSKNVQSFYIECASKSIKE